MAKEKDIVIESIEYERDFREVYGIIQQHRKRAAAVVDNECLMMLWEVGGYVSQKLKSSTWGDGVVTRLSEYIRTQDPTTRQVSATSQIVPTEMAQIVSKAIVPIELAQIPSVLLATGWSNHQIIMSRCRWLCSIRNN